MIESIEKMSEMIPEETTPETKADNEIIKALYDVGKQISDVILKITEETAKKEMETEETEVTDDNGDNDETEIETEIEESEEE